MERKRAFRDRTRDRIAALSHHAQRLSLAVGVAVIFGLGFAAGNLSNVTRAQGTASVSPEVEQAFAPLFEIYNQLDASYIDEVSIETLVVGAATGMMESLGDPFSAYMSPAMYNMMNADLEGEIQGIGVVIRTLEETNEVQVVGIIRGSPAESAGIQRGDIFAAVDGVPIDEIGQTELAERVRGPEGTQVTIIMQRGDEQVEFTITRARIVVPNVESRILDGDVVYIRLNQFSANAHEELQAALDSLDVNKRVGLIFDLRDDPGGLLSSAIDIGSLFIRDGLIVTEAFSDDNQQVFNATGEYADIQVPIIVLVNGGSASASELVAGAMQDRGVATLVGETTFGKGTVQTWNSLSNGGGVRLTVARWLTPNGNWIHENGIVPDVTVEWLPEPDAIIDETTIDPQMQAAIDLLRGATPAEVEHIIEAPADVE